MREVGAFEAKNTFSALLDVVERGEEITITRRGRPVARLVPNVAVFDRDKAVAAAERIIGRSGTMSLGGLRIKDLIEEGRR